MSSNRTTAIVVGVLALVAAVAGTAIAGPVAETSVSKKKTKQIAKRVAKKQVGKQFPVGESQILDEAVASSKIKKQAVKSSRIKKLAVKTNKIADEAVDAAKVAAGSLGTAALSASIPAARVTRSGASGAQSISDSTNTALAFTEERYDTASMHDNATNNTRLTAPVTGIYEISASIVWGPNATGRRQVFLRKNGSTTLAIEHGVPGSGSDWGQTITTAPSLQAGEYVEVLVFQNSTGALDVLKANESTPEFSMNWLAPGP